MTLSKRIINTIIENPQHSFFLTKSQSQWWRYSGNQLYNSFLHSRNVLINNGVKKGDRVAFKGKNSPEWVSWNLACNSLGGIWVPMYNDQSKDYCKYVLKDSDPTVFISDDKQQNDLNYSYLPSSIPSFSYQNPNIPYVDHDFINNEIATLIYTSGTTGNPKGVMLSNDNILSNIYTIRDRFYDYENNISLNILPWAHIYSQTCELYFNLLFKNTVALSSSRENFIKECREVRPHILYVVPRILELIKAKVEKFDKPIIKYLLPKILSYIFGGKIKYLFVGGAKINDECKNFYFKNGFIICEGYGCTETSPMVSVNHYNSPRNINTIGKILDNVCVEIIDKEIQVSGPNVMLGYWRNKEATDQVLVNRNNNIWYKTGDSGYIDYQNFLYYKGRINENYKLANGKFVNVADIESKLKNMGIENPIIFGENQLNNQLITTSENKPNLLNKINSNLESYLKISIIHSITQEELNPFFTPKMSIKRKELINYIERNLK